MAAIKLPVRAYQLRNSTLWNIRAADNERLAVELTEERAREIVRALNAMPKLSEIADDCEELSRVEITSSAERRSWKSIERQIRSAINFEQ